MTFTEFQQTLFKPEPPIFFSVQLKALWYNAKGDWHTAHNLIDHLEDRASAHIHAYLHRVEGDLWNAQYWYSRAKEEVFEGSLDAELKFLLEKFS